MGRIIPVNSNPTRQGGVGNSYSNSTDLVSYSSAQVDWWSEEESRLFTQWASSYESYSDSFNNPYFDYFFTGQDIQVTIDGLSGADDILPIYSFAYNIQQQKMPVYGYWNYTYSAVLRGTRIISGVFSIVSMYPYLLTSKIAKAAKNRAKAANDQSAYSLYALRGLDVDETRIDRYWRRTYDENLDMGQQHLFSVHPPFNFVMKYGLQDTSLVSQVPQFRSEQIKNHFNNNDAMMADYNERLIANPQPELDVRIVLENVEITSKQMQYDVNGDPLLETYSFIARDERIIRDVDKDSLTPAVPDEVETDTVVGTGGGGVKVTRY